MEESNLILEMGKIAGIGGLALGIILAIYGKILTKNIFPKLSEKEAARTLQLIVVCTWSMAIAGIISWTMQTTNRQNTDKVVKEFLDLDNSQLQQTASISVDSALPIKVNRKSLTGNYECNNSEKKAEIEDYGTVKVTYPVISNHPVAEIENKLNRSFEKIAKARYARKMIDSADCNSILVTTYEISQNFDSYMSLTFHVYKNSKENPNNNISQFIHKNKKIPLVLNLENGRRYQLNDLFKTGYIDRLNQLIGNHLDYDMLDKEEQEFFNKQRAKFSKKYNGDSEKITSAMVDFKLEYTKYIHEQPTKFYDDSSYYMTLKNHYFGAACKSEDAPYNCYTSIKGNESFSFNEDKLYIHFAAGEVIKQFPIDVSVNLSDIKDFIKPDSPLADLAFDWSYTRD